MFHVTENVPDVYVNYSRDFQLLCRLYELVFQSSRYSILSMKNISSTKNCQISLFPLLSTKLGLFEELNVPDNIHAEVLSAFPYIVRYKGSLKAFDMLCVLFSKICNTDVNYSFTKDKITIIFKSYFQYQTLFDILVDYIKPAGYSVSFVVETPVSSSTQYQLTNNTVTIHNLTPEEGQDTNINSVVTEVPTDDTKRRATVGFTVVYDDTSPNNNSSEIQ